MAIDFTKYGAPVAPSETGGRDFSKYGAPVARPETAAAQKPEVKGGFVGELLTGSTQRFGKTAGEALAAPGNADKYAEALDSHTSIQSNLVRTIREKKKLGQDTSRLDEVLKQHVESTPKLEDFTGEVVNKKTGQIIGEAAGTVLEASTGGILSSGKKVVTSKVLSTAQKVKEGAKVGAAYGSIGGATTAMQEGEGVGGTLKQAASGAAIGAGLGGGLGYAGAKAGAAIDRFGRRVAIKAEQNLKTASKVTGEILQGETDDIARGQRVLQTLDPEKVKTYEQGFQALDERVKKLSADQDALLAGDKTVRRMADLNVSQKIGDGSKAVKHNYVKDALSQLADFYKKTNDQVGLAELNQLKTKATRQGLTVQEINDIARLHGQKLNAYNASGELASGLSKQAAENTRAGLKTTVRDFYGGEPSKLIDKEIGDTIRVRDLFQKNVEAVNKLKQRIQERSLGAKAGYLVGKIINTIGLGSPKGIVEALIPRGQGFKVMNALDLEKNLQKNLKILQEITKKDMPESEMIKALEKFFMSIGGDNLQAKAGLPSKPAKLTK